jgi:arginase family enzyme
MVVLRSLDIAMAHFGSPWHIIEAGLVTPGGQASALDAPAALRPAFGPAAGPAGTRVDFDRTAPWAQAARHSCVSLSSQVRRALVAGARPLILGGECSLIAGSLSAAFVRWPELVLLFLDAHADFNTPETSPSGYFGGMCLAHACGSTAAAMPWEAPAAFPGEQVWLVGGRALDPGEPGNLERAGVHQVAPGAPMLPAIAGASVWLHVDLDIIDPCEMIAVSHPVPGGIGFSALRRLLEQISSATAVKGVEICGYLPEKDPERLLPGLIAAAFAPVLSS